MTLASLTPRRASAVMAGGLAVFAVVAVVAAPAGAATVDLAGGSTTLKLDAGAAAALKSLHVGLSPTGKAKASAKGVAFPITGGTIDPATAAGTINHTGGLALKAGKVKVTLSDFVITTSPSGMSAKVNGGARLDALAPVLSKAKISRDGLGTTVSGVGIHLSAKGAAALNKAFGVTAFRPRLKLGTATVVAKPATVAFTGGQTELALDPGAVAALTSLGVTPGVVAPATAAASGALAFPITGGSVALKTLAGQITHSGGISLTKGATAVTLTDFTVDTVAKQLTGVINGGARAALLDLDLSSPSVSTAGLSVTVANVPAALTPGAAAALNSAFGVTAFSGGLKFGVAKVAGAAA